MISTLKGQLAIDTNCAKADIANGTDEDERALGEDIERTEKKGRRNRYDMVSV